MANLIYNRDKIRVNDVRAHELYVFGSSSAGNSIYFKPARVLIDLGFPYKTYQQHDLNFFLNVDYIMLTHEHSDHLNVLTLLRICQLYPWIKIIIPPAMWQDMLMPEFIAKRRVNLDKLIQYKDRFIEAQSMKLINKRNTEIQYLPHVTAHGPINNCAIELLYNNEHVLYASDLDSYLPNFARHTQGLPQDVNNPFDMICLEANYDEEILYNYIKTHPNSFRAKENLRHTSEQKAWTYVQKFLKPDGIFIPLHASHAFGTLWQDLNGSFEQDQERTS